ncbi:hypothetical protein CRENBAI_002192 [Crenichthys baileyi]|uniref:DNA-directed DNA polymerase X domain-containing protein n=1 Tax=Crenichthys baileyi TaxID=28760 RepID=A0AAV9RVG5_9TELE
MRGPRGENCLTGLEMSIWWSRICWCKSRKGRWCRECQGHAGIRVGCLTATRISSLWPCSLKDGTEKAQLFVCDVKGRFLPMCSSKRDAFEVLAENYELNEIEGRCLAFRRAASVLKSLPRAVQCVGATQDLPCLGEHTKAVMKSMPASAAPCLDEILQYGRSFEVEKILSDERCQTLKLFTSVFGVGPKTAEKWYRRGFRSFSGVLSEPSIQLNRMQQSGFLHYGDISRAVSKAEAQAVGNIIDEAVHVITPNAILALTGGFRSHNPQCAMKQYAADCEAARIIPVSLVPVQLMGKEFGHDVDFILTTPELGREESLLTSVIDHLKKQQRRQMLFSRIESDCQHLPQNIFGVYV